MDDNDKPKFVVAVGAMLESFGVEATRAILHGYWIALRDLSVEQLESAVEIVLRSCKFTPKPFELRDAIGIVVSSEANAINAWADVQRALRIGAYKSVDFDDKLINAAIRSLGGWPNFVARFTDSQQEEFARHAFGKTYRNLAASYVTGEACKPLPGLSQISMSGGEVLGPARIGCDAVRAAISCPIRDGDSVRNIGQILTNKVQA